MLRPLLSLNTIEIINDREDTYSDDDLRALLRPGHPPIKRIKA
jgi:hypothetical protein